MSTSNRLWIESLEEKVYELFEAQIKRKEAVELHNSRLGKL